MKFNIGVHDNEASVFWNWNFLVYLIEISYECNANYALQKLIIVF